jgi:hypothetical protein
MGEIRNIYRVFYENVKGTDHLGDLGVHGRI